MELVNYPYLADNYTSKLRIKNKFLTYMVSVNTVCGFIDNLIQ